MTRSRTQCVLCPPYAALAADGVVDCTIAIGYDERAGSGPRDPGGASGRVDALVRALRGRGYVEGADAALPLLPPGHGVDGDACSTFLSRKRAFHNALDPHAPLDVVIRIVANTDGQRGPEAARVFVNGLARSSICVYAGHARHGLGPDFDPAIVSESATGPYADTDRLLREASREAEARHVALELIMDEWFASGRLAVDRSARSRVLIDDRAAGRQNPRARFMRWLATIDRGERSPAAFGPHGVLASSTPARHRLWFLLACRSVAWFPAIRGTPGLHAGAVTLVGCPDQAGPGDLTRFPWALDAMGAGESWPWVLRALDGSHAGAARFTVDGLDTNGSSAQPRASA